MWHCQTWCPQRALSIHAKRLDHMNPSPQTVSSSPSGHGSKSETFDSKAVSDLRGALLKRSSIRCLCTPQRATPCMRTCTSASLMRRRISQLTICAHDHRSVLHKFKGRETVWRPINVLAVVGGIYARVAGSSPNHQLQMSRSALWRPTRLETRNLTNCHFASLTHN
jgi:hypothetical protein